jgi:hypothetical protein
MPQVPNLLRVAFLTCALGIAGPAYLIADVQQIQPTYIALKTTPRERLDDGATFRLTLASGAWVKLRSTDID